jgi:hypothetical protein
MVTGIELVGCIGLIGFIGCRGKIKWQGAAAQIPGANMEEFLVTILDGFVKSPTAALRFIFRHCGVLVSTPHSSRFTSLAFGAFYFAVPFFDFLRPYHFSVKRNGRKICV